MVFLAEADCAKDAVSQKGFRMLNWFDVDGPLDVIFFSSLFCFANLVWSEAQVSCVSQTAHRFSEERNLANAMNMSLSSHKNQVYISRYFPIITAWIVFAYELIMQFHYLIIDKTIEHK